LALLGLALALGACQSSRPPAAPVELESKTKHEAPPVEKARPVAKIARAAPKPKRIYPDPDGLKGVAARDLIGVIGKPEFIRKDRPAEIWQYRGAACTLDIFLYQNVTGEPYRVDYIETRAHAGGPTSNRACLTSILKARETAGPNGAAS